MPPNPTFSQSLPYRTLIRDIPNRTTKKLLINFGKILYYNEDIIILQVISYMYLGNKKEEVSVFDANITI